MSQILIDNRKVISQETGEIIEEDSEIRFKTEEPDYVKLYLNAWCEFKEIKGINRNLFYKILPYMTYAEEGQIIGFTACIKRRIAEKLGWKETNALNRFNHELKKMVNSGILKNIGRDTYQVNPELIGKGKWKDIRKLRATFNLETGEVTHSYCSEAKETN